MGSRESRIYSYALQNDSGRGSVGKMRFDRFKLKMIELIYVITKYRPFRHRIFERFVHGRQQIILLSSNRTTSIRANANAADFYDFRQTFYNNSS